jgi:phosphoglycolate phosphatase-like HAD superfamily hydrolase/ribosomal protein S18 acetylase RimI-like enzyme
MLDRFAAVLLDVDGTLLRAGGAGRRAFERALADHLGPVDGAIAELRFDGMTDRLIVRESLRLLGRPFDERTCDAILGRYLAHLPAELTGPGFRVLPGVASLLAELRDRRAAFGLCTGNVAGGARAKLAHGGLDRFFDWGPAGMHGFAEDGEARERVVAAAVARVAVGLGRPVAPAEVLVVGDTPRDVAAAHAVGCAALCVATGTFDAAALRAAGADAVVPDLADEGARALVLGALGPRPDAPVAARPPLPDLDAPRLAIRPAGRADTAALQACLDGVPDYFERLEGAPADPGAAGRLLDDVEADPLRRVWLLALRRGGTPVGLIDLWLDQPEPGTAHLGLLAVREPFQGLGYGAEATAALERALASAGIGLLRLSVGDESPGALAFWERLGFAAVGRLGGGVTVLEKPVG